MANMIDYAASNNRPMTEDGFNEIDGLILSELGYVHWDEISDLSDADIAETGLTKEQLDAAYRIGGKGLTLQQLIRLFKKTYYYQTKVTGSDQAKLLDKLENNERFANILVSNFDENNKSKGEGDRTGAVDTIEQFAAVTFTFDNKGCANKQNFVSFRGTDGTLEGWNEDFLMAFETETEAQRHSVEYLNNVARYLKGDIRMGGHSKGGNDSNYAFLFCDEEIRKRIVKLYSYDGPGFIPGITYRGKEADRDVYIKMLELLEGSAIAPYDSLIGKLLMENGFVYVDTDGKMLLDHDPFTWQIDVEGNSFATREQSKLAIYFDEVLDDWITSLPEESRKAFVNTIWEFIYKLDPKSFDDVFTIVGEDPLKSFSELFVYIRTMPIDKQIQFSHAFMTLLYYLADDYLEQNIKGYVDLKKRVASKLNDMGLNSLLDVILYLLPDPLNRAGDLVVELFSDPDVVKYALILVGEFVLIELVAFIIDVVAVVYLIVDAAYKSLVTAISVMITVVKLMLDALKQAWNELTQLIGMAVDFVKEKIHQVVQAVRMHIIANFQATISVLFFTAAKMVEGIQHLAHGVKEVVMEIGGYAAECLDFVVKITSPLVYSVVRGITGLLREPVRIDMRRLQSAVDLMEKLASRTGKIDSRLNSLYGRLCWNNIEQEEGIFTSLANLYHLASADIKVDQGYRIRRKANGLKSLFDDYKSTESWVKQQLS